MPNTTVSSVYPEGQTYFVSANTTSTSVNVTANGNSVNLLYVENLDLNNDVFVAYTTQPGNITATAPTVGTPQSGLAVQNGQGRVIQISALNQFNAFANVAVVTFGGNANVTITPVA